MKRRMLVTISLVLVVVALAVSVQSVRMHRTYGEWALSAPEAPTHIDALSRQYEKGDLASAGAVPAGFVASGTTAGGATVLAPQGERPQPTVIYVRDSDRRVWTYALVGGP
ncbi:hypothetical protein BH09ACT12_BH09ACT12_36080 [soil metagenome]